MVGIRINDKVKYNEYLKIHQTLDHFIEKFKNLQDMIKTYRSNKRNINNRINSFYGVSSYTMHNGRCS